VSREGSFESGLDTHDEHVELLLALVSHVTRTNEPRGRAT
jgi:hypothetical protein